MGLLKENERSAEKAAAKVMAITAAIFFKEKLTVRSVCGLITGIVSLIVINMF